MSTPLLGDNELRFNFMQYVAVTGIYLAHPKILGTPPDVAPPQGGVTGALQTDKQIWLKSVALTANSLSVVQKSSNTTSSGVLKPSAKC